MKAGYGDLARTVPLARQGVRARADMARLSQELTTGRHSDLAKANRGDLRQATGIQRNLAILASTKQAAQTAQHRMASMQAALGAVSEAMGQAASAMISLSDVPAQSHVDKAADTAHTALGAVVSALRTRVGGINLFSGTATDDAPLPEMGDMLSALRAAVNPATQPDAASLIADVRAWFAPGTAGPAGGLDTLHVVEGGDARATITVAPGETLAVPVTAADEELRDLMASLAAGVLAAEMAPEQGRLVHRQAGIEMLGDQAGLGAVQARLGVAEAQSERALGRVSSEINALEMARAEFMEVDRYEAATAFQAAEAAVETLYLVTARLSALSLANYMR